MWIKRTDRIALSGDDIPRSEITPHPAFANRRRVLQAAGAAALGGLIGVHGEAFAAFASPDPKAQKLAAKTNPKFVVADSATSFKDITTYNNYYEFGTDKAPAGAQRRHAAAASVAGERRGRGEEREGLRHRRIAEARAARGTGLPASVCRGLVDGDSVDRHPVVGSDQARATDRQCQICAVHHAGRSVADAGPFGSDSRLAVFRRPADGRSDESADAVDDGPLWPGAAEPERRARCGSSCPGSTASRVGNRW